MLRRLLTVPMAVAMGWALMIAPAHAGFLMESPTSVGTLSVTNAGTPNPTSTLTLGGASLLNSFDGRPPGSYAQSIFKFNLSSLLPGTQITSAFFTFTVSGAQPVIGLPSLNVSGLASNSPTVTIPDFTAPTVPIGSTGTLPNSAPGTLNLTFILGATSYIQSLVNGNVSTVGFLTSVPNIANVFLYGDDPSNPTAFRPTLSITFTSVPEPTSLTLCGLAGMIGLAFAKARRGRAV